MIFFYWHRKMSSLNICGNLLRRRLNRKWAEKRSLLEPFGFASLVLAYSLGPDGYCQRMYGQLVTRDTLG